MKRLSIALCLTTLTALTGCDEAEPVGAADDAGRGRANGKADGLGSCDVDSCGGQASDGSCYCDAGCVEYGDCCDNYEPVCLGDGAGVGEGCELLAGCGDGAYCHFSGEGQFGECRPASDLQDAALAQLAQQYPELGATEAAAATVGRNLRVFGGAVQPDSSEYTVRVAVDDDRVAYVRLDLQANHKDTWREIPQDVRDTAPWGSAQYLQPGMVMMTMDGSTTLDAIHDMIVGPVLDSLTMRDVHRSHDGSMWFFNLEVPGFAELETIGKVADEGAVIEAWPNRILELVLYSGNDGLHDTIAEL